MLGFEDAVRAVLGTAVCSYSLPGAAFSQNQAETDKLYTNDLEKKSLCFWIKCWLKGLKLHADKYLLLSDASSVQQNRILYFFCK